MSSNFIQIAGAVKPPASGVIKVPAPGQTILLAHFDEAGEVDATGRFYSGSGKTRRSFVEKKFGAGSYDKAGADSSISIASVGSNRLLDTDFTIESWVKPIALDGFSKSNGIVCVYAPSDNRGMHLAFKDDGSLVAGNYRDNLLVSAVGMAVLNEWQHIAYTREGNLLCLWHNGVLAASSQLGGAMYVSETETVIGWGSAGPNPAGGRAEGHFRGYIDEMRIVKGLAVYTENFTPQDTPFTL